ncbi:MAG: AAA family ATPase [Eubacteriales bacterium]|nr:AAA family ATPase [Eubacteriales bacterium]
MKKLIIIGGTMGVGKTATCQALKKLLPRCAFLDGDWCWDMEPFVVTDETRAMVMDNIIHLLRNFLRCTAYEYVIFCWVLHRQDIWDDVLAALAGEAFEPHCFSLVCTEQALRARLQRDIDAGLRTADVVERSVARRYLYDTLGAQKIDVSALSAAQAARQIAQRVRT